MIFLFRPRFPLFVFPHIELERRTNLKHSELGLKLSEVECHKKNQSYSYFQRSTVTRHRRITSDANGRVTVTVQLNHYERSP